VNTEIPAQALLSPSAGFVVDQALTSLLAKAPSKQLKSSLASPVLVIWLRQREKRRLPSITSSATAYSLSAPRTLRVRFASPRPLSLTKRMLSVELE
jgi:hypothetical protein